ncbi:zinc finger protein 43 [Triplophysa rosa]|uniref:Zinc finger protein 41-like n=1 Tax=Triplophysa rosa TaxID=992332 RepID=A0A9W7WRR1_TRIRA|nr:zinc finger protein 43 [Triplophysa rosa]KAI7807080.1 putative zinc finger protein 41-like [Triplophysa rosa]
MAYTSMNFAPGGGDMFICTECGEGFRHYPKLVEHMAIHSLVFPDALSVNGTNNTHIEFALHENGTLTVVDRSVVSNFSFLFGKPPPKLSWCPTPNQAVLTSSKMPEKECAQFRCERCGQAFKSQKSLQLHQQYRVLEQGFRCTLCCKVFNDRESLQSHLQNHAHERFYSCGHCGKRFLRQEALLSHKKQWHASPASKALTRAQEDQENSMEKSYPCKVCGLRFFWLSDLQSHLNSHSRVKKPPSNTLHQQEMRGDEARKTNPTSQLKKLHVSQYPGENEDNDFIDLSAEIKRESPAHYGKMRQMTAKKRFNPVMAGIRRRRRRASKVHHDSKLFSCKYCHRGFLHSSSLSRHMRYHKGTLPVCVYCGRFFSQRCDVTRHVAMFHSSTLQPKPNEALKTNKSSKQDNVTVPTQIVGDEGNERKDLQEVQHSSNVDNKLSLDSEEQGISKPRIAYKCKECSRVFALLSAFKRHVHYHKRDPARTLLLCPFCPSRFTFRSALDRHIEGHKERFKTDETKLANSNVDDPENQHKDIDAGEPNTNENDSLPLKVLN